MFCLLIQQNIKEKRKVSIAYLNRMASMLIFSLEQNTDYMETLSVYEKSLRYSFQLFSDTDSFLYQSENLEDCSEIIDTFLYTLQHHQYQSYALSPESEISLNASAGKNELIITIIDHGIGISDKDKPFIFNRFYQCDKSRTQREHFGLGLSIANELVSKLDGKIWLFDTAGGGCTFKIFLPLK